MSSTNKQSLSALPAQRVDSPCKWLNLKSICVNLQLQFCAVHYVSVLLIPNIKHKHIFNFTSKY